MKQLIEGQIVEWPNGKPKGIVINYYEEKLQVKRYIVNDTTVTTRMIRSDEDLNNIKGKNAFYDENGILCTKPISKRVGKFLTNAIPDCPGYVMVQIKIV